MKLAVYGFGAVQQRALSLVGIALACVACSEGANEMDPGMGFAGTGSPTPGAAGTLGLPMTPMSMGAGTGSVVTTPPMPGGAGTVSTPPMAAGSGSVMMPAAGSGEAGMGGEAGAAGAAGMAGGPSTGLPDGHCLAGITNFDSDGPFDYESGSSGAIKFWVPNVPAGCKVPVVHVANGTGATCSFYSSAIARMASHGFLTACYENANTGAGTQGLEALMTAVSEYPDIADLKFGSTGHSQGGQAAFVVLQFAEEQWGDQGVYAGLAMQPASGFGSQPTGGWRGVYGMIKSPMFMFSGQGSDGLVSQGWVQDGFDALADTVEAYHWAKSGSSHFSPNGPQMEVSIAWFRWKLLGDQAACMHFKMVREDPSWEEAAVQNEAPCM